MNNYIINSSTLAEIGDTIRDKSGISEPIPVPEIPKHIENVYEAGKNSMVDESKLLPTTVSGNYISVDDVSEVPHEVECKISGVDNPQNVKVTRHGKNLFNVLDGEGYYEYWLKPNTSYTLSSNCPKFTGTASIYFNGGSSYPHGVCADRPGTTVTDENGYLFIELRKKPGNDPLKETYASYDLLKSGECWAQLEEGSAATEYEPYVETQTLTPAADGTVAGMTSVSPYMNIFTNTEGVNIDVTYNKSWGMQEFEERFYNSFRQGIIHHSISFEWLELSKESITSIISALSPTAIGQAVTFKKSTKEATFTDEEWQELISTKPNWTFALL